MHNGFTESDFRDVSLHLGLGGRGVARLSPMEGDKPLLQVELLKTQARILAAHLRGLAMGFAPGINAAPVSKDCPAPCSYSTNVLCGPEGSARVVVRDGMDLGCDAVLEFHNEAVSTWVTLHADTALAIAQELDYCVMDTVEFERPWMQAAPENRHPIGTTVH